MNAKPLNMQVGDFTCHVIPAISDFKQHWNALLVQTLDEVILIDPGPRLAKTSDYVAGLIEHNQIDQLVLTHTPIDGVVEAEDDAGNFLYSNADIIIQTAEWDWWQAKYKGQSKSYHSRLVFVDGEVEFASGLTMIPAPVRSPGQVVVLITSGGEQLLYLSALLIAPFQLGEPSVYFISHEDELALTNEAHRTKIRRSILRYAVDKNLVSLFRHFPFPGLGYINRTGNNFDWKPIVF